MKLIDHYSNVSNYLDLGGALSAFGLIFAVYQLRKPQWDLVLRLRSGWQRNLFWILGVAGLLLTLIRVLFTFDFLVYPFNIPLTYEILAYLFFIASPLALLFFSTNAKELFNEKTSKKFYKMMIEEISRTNDEGVNAALEVLLYNFRDICRAARFETDKKFGQYARAVLDVILSDESVVKILTTKRLDALQSILDDTEEFEIDQSITSVGIPKIVQNLFYDKESFFYKHLSREGLALPLNIYKNIFDSPVILTHFDLFGSPTLDYSMRKNIGITGIEVFMEALSRAIKTYLKTGDVPPRHINNGLSHLSDIFGDLCLKISIEEERGVDTKYSLKDEWWAIHLIADFLGRKFPFLAYKENLDQGIAEMEKSVLDVDFHSDSTINAGVAEAIYKAFEQLSYIKNTTDTYHDVRDLLHGMIYCSEYKEGYRKPFEKRMWEQIGHNIIGRFYPATLKIYLECFGYHAASDKEEKIEWLKEQTERIRRLLYIDLKPLIDQNAEMVNKVKIKEALLPKTMDYKEGKFTYRFGLGSGEEKVIAPPQEGAESALTGVDLKFQV